MIAEDVWCPATHARRLSNPDGYRDVSALLERVEARTLVIFNRGDALGNEQRSRELTTGIAGAHLHFANSNTGLPDADDIAVIDAFLDDAAARAAALDELTTRETEVLSLVASGASNAEVAKRLSISINTVTRHLTHIYAKTGARGRSQAIRYALQRGLGR